MKVLLDENIDVRFRRAFDESKQEVYTVSYMGWSGIRNGELLAKMREENFDVLIAVDKGLPYEQNAGNLGISIFILDVKRNTLSRLLPFVPELLTYLEGQIEKKVYVLKEKT
jgi:predicted nuclease of predicted toxin-antitoxin system